jgi:Protein of unknown function (DUF2281).
MGKSEEKLERKIINAFRRLPPEKKQEVVDFIEFIESRNKLTESVEFDEWAVNLAKEKGFSHLTEEDVMQIVKAHRGADK